MLVLHFSNLRRRIDKFSWNLARSELNLSLRRRSRVKSNLSI